MKNTDDFKPIYKKVELYNLFCVTNIISIFYRGLPRKRTTEYTYADNDFWELFYVDRGDISLEIDNRNVTLSAGQGVLYAQHSSHLLAGSSHYSSNVVSISFDCNNLDDNFFGNKVFVFNAFEKNILSHLINVGNQYFERFSNDPFGEKGSKLKANAPNFAIPFVKISIEYLLLLLYQKKTFTNIEKKTSHIKLSSSITQAIDFMYQNLDKKLTIDDIASHVKMSSTQFRIQFKKELGKSVIDYFNDIKVEHAKILIREDVYTLSEISLMLGYCSESYFSRQFKQKANMTPSEYARLVNYVSPQLNDND